METTTTKRMLLLENGARIIPVEAAHTVERDERIENGIPCEWMHAVIRFEFEGTEICAEGQDTEHALQQVEYVLPRGWHIRCCASCRHGHYCVYGNADNLIWCITDFEPATQRDLWPVSLYSDPRKRSLFCCCERFVRPGPGDYWYNDFLFRVDDQFP